MFKYLHCNYVFLVSKCVQYTKHIYRNAKLVIKNTDFISTLYKFNLYKISVSLTGFQCTLQSVKNRIRILGLVTILALQAYQLPSFEVQSMENPTQCIQNLKQKLHNSWWHQCPPFQFFLYIWEKESNTRTDPVGRVIFSCQNHCYIPFSLAKV